MPTTVVFGDTSDAVISSTGAVYLTERAGGTLAVASPTSTTALVGQNFGANYTLYEAFLAFDTSVIGAQGVASATLELRDANDFSTTDFVIEVRLDDWGTAVETTDWVPGASLGGLPLLATYNTTLGWTGASLKMFTDVAMAANINGSGFTRFVVSSDRLRLGTAPTGDERINFVTADNGGTVGDPKLTIVTLDVASFGAVRSRAAPQARAG